MKVYARLSWFHTKTASKCYPNSSHIVEKFNISQRQAQRDIELLKTEFGAPIKYSHERKGYYYTESFELPVTDKEKDTEYIDMVSEAEHNMNDQFDDIQLRLPYSAQLRIKDKLTVMDLRRYVVSRESRDVYNVEFYNVDSFIGILFVSDADIEIIKPDWLRERMVATAKRILANNS